MGFRRLVLLRRVEQRARLTIIAYHVNQRFLKPERSRSAPTGCCPGGREPFRRYFCREPFRRYFSRNFPRALPTVLFTQLCSGISEKPCMTLPRQVVPGRDYMVTRRCSERRFFLRPDEDTNNPFIYCLWCIPLRRSRRGITRKARWATISGAFHRAFCTRP